MTATSGRNLLDSFGKSGRLGSLEKMLLGTSQWASMTCLLAWKPKATSRGHLLFRLVPSALRTEETGSGLWPTPRANDPEKRGMIANDPRNGLPAAVLHWPTPHANCFTGAGLKGTGGPNLQTAVTMFPTPRASDGEKGGPNQRFKNGQPALAAIAAMWPTPSANDNRDRGNLSSPSIQRRKAKGKQLMLSMVVSHVSGQLNPQWVEWLMGFPPEWTALDPSEMPSSPKSRKSSVARLRKVA